MVGFVDDDYVPAAGGEFPERAFPALDEIDGGDDAWLGAPRIGAGFERPARLGHALAVEDFELEAELGGQLGLPLLNDGRRTDNQNPRSAAAGVQFA